MSVGASWLSFEWRRIVFVVLFVSDVWLCPIRNNVVMIHGKCLASLSSDGDGLLLKAAHATHCDMA